MIFSFCCFYSDVEKKKKKLFVPYQLLCIERTIANFRSCYEYEPTVAAVMTLLPCAIEKKKKKTGLTLALRITTERYKTCAKAYLEVSL